MACRVAVLISALVVSCCAATSFGQAPEPTRPGATGWRAPLDGDGRYGSSSDLQPSTMPAAPITPAGMAPQSDEPLHAQVSKGAGTLPNEHGQVWREYDISPYTMRVESSQH